MDWPTGQRHRKITDQKVKIRVKFDHECKIQIPDQTICFPCVGAYGMEITFPTEHVRTYKEFRHSFMLAYFKVQASAKPCIKLVLDGFLKFPLHYCMSLKVHSLGHAIREKGTF